MATDVSSFHRVLKDDRTARKESGGAKSTDLITRDFFGIRGGGGDDGDGGSAGGAAFVDMKSDRSEKLNLDLQVPKGWEKRLDLKSGRVYLQRCYSSNSSQPVDGTKHKINRTVSKLQDLNFPSSPTKLLLNFFDETNLELKLVSSSSTNYQSVCTLDKVKSALEMATKESIKKRSLSSSPLLWKSSLSSSSYSSSSSSSIKTPHNSDGGQERLFSSPVATGCPGCLSYVLIMKHNPRCPRCNTAFSIPASKKPRIDLNISI